MATSTQTEKPFNHLKGIHFESESDGPSTRAEFNEFGNFGAQKPKSRTFANIAPFCEVFFKEIKKSILGCWSDDF